MPQKDLYLRNLQPESTEMKYRKNEWGWVTDRKWVVRVKDITPPRPHSLTSNRPWRARTDPSINCSWLVKMSEELFFPELSPLKMIKLKPFGFTFERSHIGANWEFLQKVASLCFKRMVSMEQIEGIFPFTNIRKKSVTCIKEIKIRPSKAISLFRQKI